MIQRLCKVLVLAAAATFASCGGGGGGSSSGGGLPSTSSAPTPKPTPTPAGPFAVQWNSYWSFAQPALNVFMPKAAAPGDVLILALWNNGQADGAPNAYTAPAGWTQVDSGEEYYGAYQAFQHVVTAADTNTYAFTASSAARLTLWMAVDVANTSATTPVDQSANAYHHNETIFNTPALTPSHAGELALALHMPITTAQETWTNPSDWAVGAGPTYYWHGEALSQTQAGAATVSETSTLSASSYGWSALMLLNTSGI